MHYGRLKNKCWKFVVTLLCMYFAKDSNIENQQ